MKCIDELKSTTNALKRAKRHTQQIIYLIASIAQLVERLIVNLKVFGSSPNVCIFVPCICSISLVVKRDLAKV